MTKQQFNNLILEAAHRLLNIPDLQHIDGNMLMYYIATEIEHSCEEAVELIEQRHQDDTKKWRTEQEEEDLDGYDHPLYIH